MDTSPGRNFLTITPSDTAELPGGWCRAVRCKEDGTLQGVTIDGGSFSAEMIAGQYLLVGLRKILAATTGVFQVIPGGGIVHAVFGELSADPPALAMRAHGAISERLFPVSGNTVSEASASGSQASWVRVAADTPIWVAFGTAPDATRDDGARFLMPAAGVEFFTVPPGSKIAVALAI